MRDEWFEVTVTFDQYVASAPELRLPVSTAPRGRSGTSAAACRRSWRSAGFFPLRNWAPDRLQTEAVGSSRQICGVFWCRRYRVIPKSTIRIARTTQMLTRMQKPLVRYSFFLFGQSVIAITYSLSISS